MEPHDRDVEQTEDAAQRDAAQRDAGQNGEAQQNGEAAPRENGEAATEDEVFPRPIVAGIGASAGGIEALQAFFEAVPEKLGVAFVVVVHLSPEHRSELAEILGRKTSMPVEQVGETVPLRGDRVYVIPPGRQLRITDTHIGAFPFEEPRGQRTPIDHFFRSLAAQHGDGFAVILSGGGSDGSVGVKAVKEAGGLVLVQDPTEAAYDSMPRSAIATGMADLVLPVRDLAGRLADLTHTKRRIHETLAPPGAAQPAALDADGEVALGRILGYLHARTGHDFAAYKRATVLRRIGRRMQVHRKETLQDYLAYLRQNVEEAQALFDDLLISVTTFFRDAEAWETLTTTVVPQLFDAWQPDEAIRVWIPGCATGEEAYSLAIVLLEEAERRGVQPTLQVFASDLDEGALATGREGRYPAAVEADLSPERLRRFFEREGDHVRVTKDVRDCVLFATHSLLRDPPFSRLDLVSCRNLLIYLDRASQEQVFAVLHYALRPGGFLFLGSSEAAGDGLFRTLDKRHRLFQAREVAAGARPPLPDLLLATPRVRTPAEHERARRAAPPPHTVHQRVLEDLGPPSALVDDAWNVVHLSETAGRYLQPPGGPPTRDLTALVRPELQVELRAALHQAFEDDAARLTPFVPVRFNGTPQRVAMWVRPRRGPEGGERLALVAFVEGGDAREEVAEGDAGSEVVQRLQDELHQTRERLRASREEYEASVEELRATNEELQSSNEEHRSTAEELETSKEELQSINEELETVNAELKSKLAEVSRAHSDLENLMAATEVGTLFLDLQLRIKRFTPRVASLFNVTESDRGRPVTDFTHRLDYDTLVADAEAILADLVPVEREVRDEDGRWFLVRLRPYRTLDNRIDGVVVTFVEITALREAQEALRASQLQLEQTLEHLPVGVVLTDAGGALVYGNPAVEHIFGQPFLPSQSTAEYADWPVFLLDADEPFPPEQMPMTRSLRDGEVVVGEEMRLQQPDGSWRTIVVNTAPVPDEGTPVYAVAAFIDVTERKAAEDKLREAAAQVRELAGALTVAEQEERRRIALVLHDDLQQLLFGIQMKTSHLAGLAEKGEAAALAADARQAHDWLGDAIEITRRLTVDISPPVLKGEGLAHALEWLAAQLEEVHGLTVELRAERDLPVPDDAMRVLLFQIVRELLFNVVKHADTDRAVVTLHDGDGLTIEVTDRGTGFDPAAASGEPEGFGLFSVRERLRLFGGTMQIDAVPGEGTRVVLHVPLLVAGSK